MSRSYIYDNDGNLTHVRDTRDDGKVSYLSEATTGCCGGTRVGKVVEIADHKGDETAAYTASNFLGFYFRGRLK